MPDDGTGLKSADSAPVAAPKPVPAAPRRMRFPHLRWPRRMAIRGAGLICLVAVVALRLWDPVPVQNMRLRTFDLYQYLEPRVATLLPAVVVDIDEESLAAIGQWPWPRSVIADIMVNLFRKGAVTVGFDVVFAEADRMSPAIIARDLRGLPPDIAERLKDVPSNDTIFANVLKQAPIVLGHAAVEYAVPNEKAPPLPRTPIATLGGDPRPYLFQFQGLIRNIPELESAAPGRGNFTLSGESDGVIRRVPAVVRVGNDMLPALSIEMLRVFGARFANQPTIVIKRNPYGVESVVVAGVQIPTDENGRIWVHYARPDPRRYVSARSVLDGSVPQERIQGKLILIGTSAVGLRDIKATPIADAMPGVEVHQQLIETVMTQAPLWRPFNATGMEILIFAIAGVAMIGLVPVLGAWRTFAVGGAIAAAFVGGAWYLYSSQGMLVDFAYPAAATLVVYLVLTFLAYAQEESQRRQIRGAFSRYLSPDVVARLAEHPDTLKLGGEMREMTILFSDVQGFTRISESFDAVGLTQLINRILTPLTNAILANKGTIDKYMGDAIMAFWNAPLDDPEHARNACRAALEIRRLITEVNATVNAEAKAAGRPELFINVGVGINSGACCVGNMGSDLRFDYSVLGDSVNIASRLEGQTRNYGVGIVVGEETRARAQGFAFLELDLITVKGKTVPLRMYTLVGDETLAQTAAFQALERAHGAMLTAYRAQDWNGADAKMQEARALDPGLDLGGFYDVLAERIAEYRSNPPGAGWDGVHVASSKH